MSFEKHVNYNVEKRKETRLVDSTLQLIVCFHKVEQQKIISLLSHIPFLIRSFCIISNFKMQTQK